MMKVIETEHLTIGSIKSETEKLWVYNGLDTAVTFEVFEALSPQLDNVTRAIYEFEKDLQGPVLEINMRGIRVDKAERDRVIHIYEERLGIIERAFNRILHEGLDLDINWRSPKQLMELFYGKMALAPILKKGKVTIDRDALEKLEVNYYAGPLIRLILELRDLGKKISTLKTSVDPDGRIRTSVSIAGTNTGRFSSALGDFGSGGNLQNVTEEIRRIFIADSGMKLGYVDLEQAESRLVGALIYNLFGDSRYLDACEGGDLHTSVVKMTQPQFPWTGDLAKDRELAEQPQYRHFSYRHLCKVLGHGSNYNGQPWTMAKHTKLDPSVIKVFQGQYFSAFPGIKKWHERVRQILLSEGNITTITGRRRWFFGRRNDDATVREAIAYEPQGSVADILNRGMLNVWRMHICQLMLQIHDAILVQYPDDEEDKILPIIIEAIKVPVELNNGRKLIIPSEAKSGWNWANAGKENPDGMKKYKGHDSRVRSKPTSILDRLFV